MGKRPGSLAAYTKIWPSRVLALRQETKFYREIIQMCREKGYTNPQASKYRAEVNTPCLATRVTCPAEHLPDG